MKPKLITKDKILSLGVYSEFRKALAESGCALCALSCERTHIVVDRGNPKAQVMIIGEAPGAEEDASGKPFVGRSGRLMDALFEEAGFNTNQDALVANIAKCRPPKNRQPSIQEAQTCLPYLRRQIELIRPDFLLLMGATALKHLLPDKTKQPMRDLVGKFFDYPENPRIQVMVMFHPAYVLRDMRKKADFLSHVRAFINQMSS
jgi:DNA polymerase